MRETMSMELSLPLGGTDSLARAHAPAVAASQARWLALDVFRFAAVMLMVQGHTFTALVADTVRSQRWYGYHNYIHGFTAPMFLFGAGLAFGVTTFRRWDDHATMGPALRKRLVRYAGLILIGYGMHVPGWNLAALLHASPEQLARFAKVDALQHIGLALLVCELAVLALQRRERFVAAMACLGTAAVLVGPWAWRLPIEQWLPLGLASYVNANTGSIFPIVPWSGFVFAGIVTAHFLSRGPKLASAVDARASLALIGGGIALLAFAVDRSGLNPFGEHNFWKTSPVFFLWRVGVLLTVLAALCAVEHALRQRWPERLTGRTLGLVQLMGQESLVIYVGHLLLLYHTFFGVNLAYQYARSMDLGTATAVATVLVASMAVLAWSWRRVHRVQPSFGRAFVLVAALAMVVRSF